MAYARRCERCGWPAFSQREQELLDLICEGLSNREIGARLFLTEKTVKNYVSRLFRATDVTTRTRLVIKAFEHGYVVRPESHALITPIDHRAQDRAIRRKRSRTRLDHRQRLRDGYFNARLNRYPKPPRDAA